jgi:hypothetical protein
LVQSHRIIRAGIVLMAEIATIPIPAMIKVLIVSAKLGLQNWLTDV